MKYKLLIAAGLGIAFLVAALGISKFTGKDNASTAKSGDGTSATGNAKNTNDPTGKASASEPATLRGRVLDPDGAGLVAVVQIEDATAQNKPRVLRTDASGNFESIALSPGTYRVSATADGFLANVSDEMDLESGTTNTLELTLKRGGFEISGVISDMTGGTVADAAVTLTPIAGVFQTKRENSFASLSKADGSYRVAAHPGFYLLAASHPDYVASSRRVEVRGRTAGFDLELVPGGAVEGVVRFSANGKPAPGAKVRYRNETAGSGILSSIRRVRDSGVAVADADGRFRITGVGSGLLALRARTETGLSDDDVLVPVGIAETVTGVEVFVDQAHSISGTVVDESGIPVSGVEVLATSGGDGEVSKSSADGSFSIGPLPSGTYQVLASATRGLQNFGAGVKVELKRADVTGLTLVHTGAGLTIQGRVEPPTIASVSIALDRPGASLVIDETKTGADGAFEIGPVAEGRAPLRAISDDGRIGRAHVVVGKNGAKDVVIRLKDAAKVSGRVVDKDGKPQPGMTVNLRSRSNGDSRTVIVNGTEVSARRTVSGHDGNFAIGALEAGTYAASVKNDRGQVIRWASGESEPMEIVIQDQKDKTGIVLAIEEQASEIRGVVLGPDGKPAPDVFVTASPTFEFEARTGEQARQNTEPSDGPDGESGTSQTMMVVAQDEGGETDGGLGSLSPQIPPVLTDESGRFVISGLARGRYDVSAEGLKGTARALAPRVETGTDVRLQLANLTSLRGVVTQNGNAVEDFSLQLSGPTTIARRISSSADGSFEVKRLDPGRYTLRVRGQGGESESTIDVVSGQSNEVSITLQGQFRIVGSLVDADGKPVAGAMMLLSPQTGEGGVSIQMDGDSMPPTTGEDGAFELGALGGSFMLLALKPGQGAPLLMKPIEISKDVDLGALTTRAPGEPQPPGGGRATPTTPKTERHVSK